ncbi:hypothetical protein [uncultured Actinomyces sp.]|nr:hypothetical protein [uncultured Actinomyces sp.]
MLALSPGAISGPVFATPTIVPKGRHDVHGTGGGTGAAPSDRPTTGAV